MFYSPDIISLSPYNILKWQQPENHYYLHFSDPFASFKTLNYMYCKVFIYKII